MDGHVLLLEVIEQLKKRLAIISSHPIIYQVPLWLALSRSENLDVTVFYATTEGAQVPYAGGFGKAKSILWDIPLLEGYDWQVLKNRPLPWLNWRFKYRCPDVYNALAQGRFEAVLLVGKEYSYYRQAMKAAQQLKIPILYRAVTPFPKRNRIRQLLAHWHRRMTYKQVSAFLCVGEGQSRFYSRYGATPEKMFRTPYCVDNGFFRKALEDRLSHRDDIRSSFGFSPGTKVLGYVGKLIPVKRPLDLIRAYERLSSSFSCGLLIVGSGPLEEACRAYVRERHLPNVVFAGFKNQTELPDAYIAMDCLCLPSNSETWGLVVNEAMNFGLPIVVSDRVNCGHDLVQNGQNGFVFPRGDIETLASKLAQIFSNPDLAKLMGRNSTQIVSRHSIEENVAGIEEAMHAIC